MARPRKDAKDRQSEVLYIRQTPDARAHVDRQAALAGLEPVEYARRLLEGHQLKAEPATSRSEKVDAAKVLMTLNSLALEQSRIGNNVNQLAKAMHLDSAFTQYWQEIGEELRRLQDQVQDTLTTVGSAYDRSSS